jgi:hypothetical protein
VRSKTKVTCRVTFAPSSSRPARLVLRRGGRTVASGWAKGGRPASLRAAHALRHGSYVLVVETRSGHRTKAVARRRVEL